MGIERPRSELLYKWVSSARHLSGLDMKAPQDFLRSEIRNLVGLAHIQRLNKREGWGGLGLPPPEFPGSMIFSTFGPSQV